MMKYKNYEAVVEYDEDAHIFHGEVMHLCDVITFQGESVSELEQAFQDSVEDYLAFCKERGEKPEKPYSGKLLLRISPKLHQEISYLARQQNKSLNAVLAEAVAKYSTENSKE